MRSNRCSQRSSWRHAGRARALPPEASGDIYDRGMILAGGGSLLAGFDERLTKETELAVQLTESPAARRHPRARHALREPSPCAGLSK